MTCFWDSIRSKLALQDINRVLNQNTGITYIDMSNTTLITLLKKNNVKTTKVMWNNETLSDNLLNENLAWINQYDISCINQGHLTSSCDPFLLLISQLFVVNITHNYNNTIINYVNTTNNNGFVLTFSSNSDHFW
jgi:hypothetical protein